LLTATGCGPKACTVVGSVTLDGHPLENGAIAFQPLDGKSATAGAFIVKGHFAQQIPGGPKRVEITSPRITGKRKATALDGTPIEVDTTSEGIPQCYNTETTLVSDVKPGLNRVQYDLKSQP
jgi:hypothetical protein